MSPLRESTLSVIGAGVMAEAIIAGVLERKLVPAASIIASHPRADRRSALSEKHGIQVTADNVDAARRGDVVVLGIKPQVMPGVLSELRGSLAPGKLVISIIAFIVCFLICFAFAKYIYGFLTAPLAHALAGQPNHHLIYTALYETFFTYVKVGMFAGLCLSFPIVASQLWLFIAPGLYRHERRAFLPFIAATPILFVMGAAFVYYVMLPFAIRFFVSYETPGGRGGQAVPRSRW